MRSRLLVAYDVSDDKRLRRLYQRMLGFGVIRRVINEKEDRVMIVDLGPADGRAADCVEWIGTAPRRDERRCIII